MNKRVDQRTTKQVRIDNGLHYLLKIKAEAEKTTLKELIEGLLAELLVVK